MSYSVSNTSPPDVTQAPVPTEFLAQVYFLQEMRLLLASLPSEAWKDNSVQLGALKDLSEFLHVANAVGHFDF